MISQLAFPCKPFCTHCTHERSWLVMTRMLSDITTISFNVITCVTHTTWDMVTETITHCTCSRFLSTSHGWEEYLQSDLYCVSQTHSLTHLTLTTTTRSWRSRITVWKSNLFERLPLVLWHCWMGGRKSIRPVKNWVVGYLHGYMSGARCKWSAYGPADVTATPSSPAY